MNFTKLHTTWMDEPESARMTWAGVSLRPVVQTLFKIHGYSGKMDARYLDAAFVAKRTGAPLATVEQGLAELSREGLVTRNGRNVTWAPWKAEQADATAQQRVAAYRERRRQAPPSEEPVTRISRNVTVLRQEESRGEEKREDLNPPDPPAGGAPSQLALDGNPAEPPTATKHYTAREQAVVDAWAEAFHKSPAARRYSGKAARALQARFREGCTPEELADAVRGWATDSWRHEEPCRHSLECLVRDGGKVAQGLERLGERTPVPPANYYGIPLDSPESVKRQWDDYRAGRGDPPQIAVDLGIARAPRRRQEEAVHA